MLYDCHARSKRRAEYAAERLRLLYVAITRAKRSLVMTWNTGRRTDGSVRPAVPFLALQTWWESERTQTDAGGDG
jgi:DNA helicase-2/ATP-dependent DNA helicase PcrA